GRKRKRHDSEDDEDEDFVPTAEGEDEVESEETGGEEEPEHLDLDYDSGKGVRRSSSFDLDKHLPQQLQSAEFKVTREGLSEEETPLKTLDRFEATDAHPERWDMSLYTGGPVWAMEWCPTPDGAAATQYVAVACHQGMDDLHHVHKMYSGPGLIQLWDVGKLEYNQCPDSLPTLAYGLAHDHGFTWTLKWCPAGAWELPSCGRKAPFLPRLGLLAASSSTGVVTIYSLPHPDALNTSKNLQRSEGVVTLKMGSLKCPRQDQSGQVLCMDWLPQKPHNVIVVGFYDGGVGFWDLTTKSSLLQVRESDQSLSLLPYRCLLAHDHSVRQHRLIIMTQDRYIKTWDLRRLDGPNTVQKRYLTNEICWPLNAPGLLIAQDIAYGGGGGGGAPSEQEIGSEGGSENMNGREEATDPKNNCLPLRFQTYREAVRKYCLHHKDGDMTDPTLRLHLHLHLKVRFNPNLCSHVWVASGGQTGIIRLNCVRVMITDYTQTIISKNQVQFEEQHSPKDKEEEEVEEVQQGTR
uniref:General transcription factor IIIC, polypeptide 2, beta n=1 Tax=Cynoglossus semilaevis TaxID=244447 RepID=A0A3P8UUY3_CYNSE